MSLPLAYYTTRTIEEIAAGINDYNESTPRCVALFPKEVTISYAGVTFTVPFKEMPPK